MAKKQTAAWILMGLTEQPPVDQYGYVSYGTVYDPQRDGRPTLLENLKSDIRWGLWSWSYWGKKVRTGIQAARSDGQRHPLHGTVLALVWLTDTLYRRLTPHLEE
jgi:hypothetical protein